MRRQSGHAQTGFSKKPFIIDAHHHMVGRLGVRVSKLLLEGHKVVVLRCEDLNYSGTFYKNKLNYLSFLHKRCNVNPKRGPFHERAPAKIFQRVVRGMLPIKVKRGKIAYGNLKTFEGVPKEYMKVKKMMVPEALRVMRIKPGGRYCYLGRISHHVGWKYQDVVATLEAKRKLGGFYFASKVKKAAKKIEAGKKHAYQKNKDMKKVTLQLAKYGY